MSTYPSPSPVQALNKGITPKQLHRLGCQSTKHPQPRCNLEVWSMYQKGRQPWSMLDLGWQLGPETVEFGDRFIFKEMNKPNSSAGPVNSTYK